MSPDTMFRLCRLRLRNYHSIKIRSLSLGPLTLLVGSNGSGELSVLDALRFTSQALGENLNNALRECGGIAEVWRRSTGYPAHFTIATTSVMDTRWQAGGYEFEIGAAKNGEHRVSREMRRIRSDEFGSEDRFFKTRARQLISNSEEQLLRIFPNRLLLMVLSGQEPFGQLSDGLASIRVFSPAPGTMRAVQKPDPDDLLRRGVSSVTSVIERFRCTDLLTKIRVEEYLSHTVPGMKAIQRVGVVNQETLESQQEVQGVADP